MVISLQGRHSFRVASTPIPEAFACVNLRGCACINCTTDSLIKCVAGDMHGIPKAGRRRDKGDVALTTLASRCTVCIYYVSLLLLKSITAKMYMPNVTSENPFLTEFESVSVMVHGWDKGVDTCKRNKRAR